MNLSKTIGIIMDGNRRFAKQKGLATKEGHEAGARKLKEVLEWIKPTSIENVICYAFSTENWKRSEEEVQGLMNLVAKNLADKELLSGGYALSVIGEKEKLPMTVRTAISFAENITKHFDKKLFIALSYGGRAELVRACNNLVEKGKTSITEEDIQNELYTKDIPDPDLIIRTGGRHSLSNFLVWQSAYAELYVTDTLWPDLTKEELLGLFERFSVATRKMGA